METKTETTFAEFIRYSNWANQRMLETCQKLSEAELAAPIIQPGRKPFSAQSRHLFDWASILA